MRTLSGSGRGLINNPQGSVDKGVGFSKKIVSGSVSVTSPKRK